MRSSTGGASAAWRGVFQNRPDDAGWRVAAERPLARQHLVDHRAQRPDVAARVGLFPLHLLRRHVRHRPENRALRGAGRAAASCVIPDNEMGAAGACSFARPKSSSFAPAFVSMMLAGFSRDAPCPARCALSSASAISRRHLQRLVRAEARPFSSRAASVWPSRSGITRKCVPSAWPTS